MGEGQSWGARICHLRVRLLVLQHLSIPSKAHVTNLKYFAVLCYCRKLLEMTCRVANLLKKDGVKKGDRVAIYMPVCPLLVASMLACARIGAIHRY